MEVFIYYFDSGFGKGRSVVVILKPTHSPFRALGIDDIRLRCVLLRSEKLFDGKCLGVDSV